MEDDNQTMVDKIDVTPEEQKEDQEYIDEMVNTAEGNTSTDDPNTSEDDGEDLLAGKYTSEEDLQKGVLEALQKQNEDKSLEDIYKDLEAGLGQSSDENEVETTEDDNTDIDSPEIPDNDDDDEVKGADDDDGDNSLDFSKYEQELMENDGQLSSDSYEELAEQGFPEEVVDQYIKGLQATANERVSQIYEVTEGQENYQEMISWAQNNLSSDEIQAFNQQVNAGVNSAKFAAEALYSRYTKANGSPPENLLNGDTSTTLGNNNYESREELMEDMSDPKYKTDPAYRSRVEQKLSRSNIL